MANAVADVDQNDEDDDVEMKAMKPASSSIVHNNIQEPARGMMNKCFDTSTSKAPDAFKTTMSKIKKAQSKMLEQLDERGIGKVELDASLGGVLQVYLSMRQSMPKGLEESFERTIMSFGNAHDRATSIITMTDVQKGILSDIFVKLKKAKNLVGVDTINLYGADCERSLPSDSEESELANNLKDPIAARYKVGRCHKGETV